MGLASCGPNTGERQVPSVPGGALHRRVVGVPSSAGVGRSGRPPRPPARMTARLLPRAGPHVLAPGVPARPGKGLSDIVGLACACRGVGVAFVARPAATADAPAQAYAPSARRRPTFQVVRALRAIATPGGGLRCGAASRTLLGGARGGVLAYGSMPPLPPSRGRWKQSIRKWSPSGGLGGRMRAGARRRLTHESR